MQRVEVQGEVSHAIKNLLTKTVEYTCSIHGISFYKILIQVVGNDEIVVWNKRLLNHDYPTDIITIPYCEEKSRIEGELIICRDEVKENAKSRNLHEKIEWVRVSAHGILHLAGFNDGTNEEKKAIRKEEDRICENVSRGTLSENKII